MKKAVYNRNEAIRKIARKLYTNLRRKGADHNTALIAVIDFVITAMELD